MKSLQTMLENYADSSTALFNEPMSRHTTFKIGGNAEAFIIPNGEEELIKILRMLKNNGVPRFILGGGSNLVVSDLGIAGAVVSCEKLRFCRIVETRADGSAIVEAGAGTPTAYFVEWLKDRRLSGLTAFAALPGEIGGAAYMNARCYERSIADVLIAARFFDLETQEIVLVERGKTQWDYKRSPFQSKNGVILSCFFKLNRGKYDILCKEIENYTADRRSKGHFSYPSAGSVFKNNRAYGKPSGVIIDELGFRGVYEGGARVAPWHGNFIINAADATAQNVYDLAQKIKKAAKERGFDLEYEIIFVGRGF